MSPAATGDRMAMSLMHGLGGVPSTIQGPFGGIRIGDHVVRWGPSIMGDGLEVAALTQSEIDARLKLWDQVQEIRIARWYRGKWTAWCFRDAA